MEYKGKPKLKNFLVLIVSVCISVGASLLSYYDMKAQVLEDRKLPLEKVVHDFHETFGSYSHPLEGISAQIHFSKFKFNAIDFHRAAESRNYFENFKGALGFGFIRRIEHKEVPNYLLEQRKFRPEFNLRRLENSTSDADMFVIETVEPIERNLAAVGLVISDEKSRLDAACLARDANSVVATMPIRLVQVDKTEFGFLILKPIYTTATAPATLKERRRNLFGWAYAPILSSAIVKHIQNKNPNVEVVGLDVANPTNGDQESIVLHSVEKVTKDFSVARIEAVGKIWNIKVVHLIGTSWTPLRKSMLIFSLLFTVSIFIFLYLLYLDQKNFITYKIVKECERKIKEASEEITEQKKISMQKEKLRALGELAAGMAHEVNNPLTIIVGNSALLKKKFDVGDAAYEKLEQILKACHRIAQIVSGLRKFSRDPERVPKSKFILHLIVRESFALTESVLKEKNIEYSIQVDPKIEIFGNEVEIEQVLINLITNSAHAIKNMPNRWIKIVSNFENDEIILRVMDSGVGIEADVADRIFDPFFTTKIVGEGTGLGLSISKSLLESNDARIVLDRNCKNTCFNIYFKSVGK